MKFADALRTMGNKAHSVFLFSRWSAQGYLLLWGIFLRELPDNLTKQRLVNSLRSTRWPNLEFKPRTLRVGSKLSMKLIPHVHEFDFDALFFKELSYEKENFAILETRAKNYECVIEIGANIGIYTVFFAKLLEFRNPACQIFAFEPSLEAFYRLQQNVRLNSVTNVHLFNCAIGQQTEFTQFYEPDGHLTNGSLSFDFATNFSENVKAKPTLLLSGEMLSQLAGDSKKLLIKLDVEGAEAVVLASMKNFILEQNPDILLEVLQVTENDLNALAFLFETYDLFNMTGLGLVKHANFKATENRDYLLVPKAINP